MNSDQGFIVAILTPFFFGILVAIYAYFEFSGNGIIPPSLWVATFLAAFFTFVICYFISMTVYLWRLLR